MNILFTGASGFLGRHTVPALLAAGHTVRALSRRPEGVTLDGAEVVAGDVLDPGTLAPALEGVDAVIHAAGLVSHSIDDADAMLRLHLTGTENVLDAAKAAGVRRVVYLSTSGTVAVTDDMDAVLDERAPSPLRLVKAWPYYRSKLFAEQAALARDAKGFAVVSLNPSLLLGPGDDAEGQSTAPIRRFLDGEVPASPPGTLSFVDVRDVAAAIVSALTAGRGGRRYLLGGANMPFRELYARLARIADKPVPLANMPALTRRLLPWMPGFDQLSRLAGAELSKEELELACHNWSLDSQRAQDELGWTARDPLRTLEDTVDDIQAREGAFAPWVR